jgi:hypothetical protein
MKRASYFAMHQAFQLAGPQGNSNQANSRGFPWTKAKACARLKVAFKKHIHSLAFSRSNSAKDIAHHRVCVANLVP